MTNDCHTYIYIHNYKVNCVVGHSHTQPITDAWQLTKHLLSVHLCNVVVFGSICTVKRTYLFNNPCLCLCGANGQQLTLCHSPDTQRQKCHLKYKYGQCARYSSSTKMGGGGSRHLGLHFLEYRYCKFCLDECKTRGSQSSRKAISCLTINNEFVSTFKLRSEYLSVALSSTSRGSWHHYFFFFDEHLYSGDRRTQHGKNRS